MPASKPVPVSNADNFDFDGTKVVLLSLLVRIFLIRKIFILSNNDFYFNTSVAVLLAVYLFVEVIY